MTNSKELLGGKIKFTNARLKLVLSMLKEDITAPKVANSPSSIQASRQVFNESVSRTSSLIADSLKTQGKTALQKFIKKLKKKQVAISTEKENLNVAEQTL